MGSGVRLDVVGRSVDGLEGIEITDLIVAEVVIP